MNTMTRTLSRSLVALVAAGALAACSDASNPTAPGARSIALRSGGSTTDTSLVSGSGGGGGAGGGTGGGGTGGSTSSLSCGTLSQIQTRNNIVVYTTRTGIGVSGYAYNCSSHNESFEVDVVDVNPDPYCAVALPHYVAAKNTTPLTGQYWSATSTLVNCQGQLHTFTLTLSDTRTGQVLDTQTASVFL